MLVWAHHLFTVGYSTGLNSYFMIASMLVAVPTGIKIFNWLATLWRGNISSTHRCCSSRLHLALHHRRADGHLRRGVPGGLAGARHVFRRRALPLHAVRRRGVRDLRRRVLLVAEDVRAPARRAARQVALLAHVRGLQPHVHAAALPRPDGHAATHLHVLRGRIVGDLQPDLDHRLVRDGGRDARLRVQRPALAALPARRQRPVGRRHARVVRRLASAAVGTGTRRSPTSRARVRCATCACGCRRSVAELERRAAGSG